tara:strand:+ start:84 stop:719 length:636 start_codon:yes stop_codon:yes gene_type:complete
MFDTQALGSAPELFRNFGCGAVLLAAPFLSFDTEVYIESMVIIDQIVGQFSVFQFAIAAALIFIFYFLGALCVVLGETVISLFPGRYAERELELDAEVLLSERPALLDAYSGLQRKLGNLHAALGLGIFGFLVTLGIVGSDIRFSHFENLAFFAVIAIVATQRRVWLFYKFRILVNLVLNDPAPEPEANARKKSTEVPNKKPNEVVMSDAP